MATTITTFLTFDTGAEEAAELFTSGKCRSPAGGHGSGSFTIRFPATNSYPSLLGSTGAYCAVAHDEGVESGGCFARTLQSSNEANNQFGFAPQTFCN